VMRAKYDALKASTFFRTLRARVPILATWDDHDVGANDAGADYPKLRESKAEFLRWLDEPADSPRRHRDGVYDAHVYGPPGRRLQIVLWDTRSFRSPLRRAAKSEPPLLVAPYRPLADPAATMLGEAQWRWLREQLQQPAELRLIASSIQFVSEFSGGEAWANLPLEKQRLLDLLRRREIDVIVAYHPDRLYRRLADLVELTKVVASAGVEIRTVAAGHVDLNTASGRFTAQVLGAAAEHESARIGERVSAEHHQNAERCNAHGGGRSYGYWRVAQGQIEIVPEEAEVIREATTRVLGGQSLASIVVDFNERGISSAHGKKWRPGSLGMILRSGRITGLRESKGAVVGEANWEPILDRATWEQVCSRLTHAPIGRRPKVNLLAGMCRCAECGTVMAAVSERMDEQLKPGQRPPRRTLLCDKANRHAFGSNTVEADYVGEVVVDYVLAALEHTDIATARARRAGGDAHQFNRLDRERRTVPRRPRR